jgi:REP element-mobilizing transposase RayT
VKNGKSYSANPALENSNRQEMETSAVILSKKQRSLASQSIVNKARKLEQEIFALTVESTHVHIVAENIDQTIGWVVSYYKNAVRLSLQENGFEGKLWARGFDKRYCMNTVELNVRIDYVRRHNPPNKSGGYVKRMTARGSRYIYVKKWKKKNILEI